jgi:chemotaxis protein CheD
MPQIPIEPALEQIIVGVADCRVGSDPGHVLATFALGSCIGLSVYDPIAGVGGMLHYMLPDSNIDPGRARTHPYMFADTGIPSLIDQVCRHGAVRRRLLAHAAGAACMQDPQAVFDVGRRNYLALRHVLSNSGITLAGEAVGGNAARTIRLEIGSGRLWLQENSGPRELLPAFAARQGR